VEQEAITRIMCERLRNALKELTEDERELIEALYYQDLTERQYTSTHSVLHNAVHKRKMRILAKLKKIKFRVCSPLLFGMKNEGFFGGYGTKTGHNEKQKYIFFGSNSRRSKWENTVKRDLSDFEKSGRLRKKQRWRENRVRAATCFI
jgi:hypothetical protein